MPAFDVDEERINVFPVDDQFYFKHYFELDEVFRELREHYNSDEYRFEVPADAIEGVTDFLAEHFFELRTVEDIESYCVVKPKYTEHPKLLFRNAVLQRSKGEYNVFLLKDHLAVEQAVNKGATRLEDSDVDIQF